MNVYIGMELFDTDSEVWWKSVASLVGVEYISII